MKKVLSLLLVVLLVCAACTKGEKPVVGTWELVNSDIPGENVLELKEDGSGSIKRGEGKNEYPLHWTRDGDKLYLASEGEKEIGVFEVVSGDGKSLVLSDEGDLLHFKKKSSNIFTSDVLPPDDWKDYIDQLKSQYPGIAIQWQYKHRESDIYTDSWNDQEMKNDYNMWKNDYNTWKDVYQ